VIIDSSVLNDVALGSTRIEPEVGDSQPQIRGIIVVNTPSLMKSIIGLPTGTITADASVCGAFSDHIAALAAVGAATMLTLQRGKWTLDMAICARYVGTPVVASGLPDLAIDIINVQLTTGVILVGDFAIDGEAHYVNRRIDLILTESVLVRRRNTATGAGQTMSVTFMVSAERHL